jgi:MFS family permease
MSSSSTAAGPPRRTRLPILALFTANAISMTGNVLTLVAVPWFVLETTGSAALTGLVAFFTTLPAVIASFFGGAVVDRLGYRRMSVVSDIASGASVAAIPLLHATIGLELWMLLTLVFAGALLDGPGSTARSALVPDLAELAGMSLERASGTSQAINRGASLLGAPLAGLLIAFLGASNVLWIDAVSFAASALVVRVLVPLTGEARERSAGGYLTELREGLSFIGRDRLILAVVLTAMFTNFLDAPLFSVLLPIYATRIFGSALDLGLVIGAFGGAALISAVAFGAIGHRLPRRLTFGVAFVAAGLPFWVLALLPPLPVVIGCSIVTGLAGGPINPIISTAMYERVPPRLRGRVLGAVRSGAYVAIPAGVLVAGLLVEWIGLGGVLVAIAASYLVVTVSIFLNPAMRGLERAPQAAPQPGG